MSRRLWTPALWSLNAPSRATDPTVLQEPVPAVEHACHLLELLTGSCGARRTLVTVASRLLHTLNLALPHGAILTH